MGLFTKIVKYRCSHCGHVFKVENPGSSAVQCQNPGCGSPDVIPLSTKTKLNVDGVVKIIVAIFVLMMICFGVYLITKDHPGDPGPGPGPGPNPIDTTIVVCTPQILSISPSGVVKPFDEITIKTKDMGEIQKVEFAGNDGYDTTVLGSDIRNEDGKVIVKVPKTAITGRIKIADTNDSTAVSNDKIHIAGPEISQIKEIIVAGLVNERIDGENLDLIERVYLPNGDEATHRFDESANALMVTIPAHTPEGEIVAETSSGIKLTILKVKKPKVTQGQVQQWMDDLKNGSSRNQLIEKNDQVISNVRYTLTNPEGAEVVPTNAAGIQEKFVFEDWLGVTVIRVGYDTQGRVSAVTYSAEHNPNNPNK